MCTNAHYIKRPDGSRMLVGCGHCLQCLKQYQDTWIARLNEECKQWLPVVQDGKPLPPIIFFTFDYAPERIPCTYLVVTDKGVYITETCPPGIPVHQFWTTLQEPSENWNRRRLAMLREYYKLTKLVWSTLERPASVDDVRNGNFRSRVTNLVFGHYGVSAHRARCEFDCDLPDFECKFKRFDGSVIDYPDFDFEVLRDYCGDGKPLAAFEFHSVSKSDVQSVFKRARRSLQYHLPETFSLPINPRMKTTWIDSDGIDREFPTASYTSTFKYFLTSEYGPRTFRPHYHGVCFGLTFDEFERFIAHDWESHGYGRCKFSVLRSSGGALAYLGKYCSKGNYEHPFCCKDFIYPPKSDGYVHEYHSKYYELTRATFGFSEALAKPTFHLISKGIGACYAFSSEVQKYFGVELMQLYTACGSLRYSATDSPDSVFNHVKPSISLDRLLCVVDGDLTLFKSIDVRVCDDGSILVRKYDNNDNLIGESVIARDAVINTAIEDIVSSKLYTRSYVSEPRSSVCYQCWHKVGAPKLCNPKTKTTSISLPRYYRQWLVSPLSSLLRSSSAVRMHPSAYEVVSGLLESGRSADEVESTIRSLMADEVSRNSAITSRLWRSSQNQRQTYAIRLK